MIFKNDGQIKFVTNKNNYYLNFKTMENNQPYKSEKKIIAGILGILVGYLGIHKFYLGYTKEGVIQIIATFVTFGFAGLIGFIEGIIYLTKSDEEFDKTYVEGHKGWF